MRKKIITILVMIITIAILLTPKVSALNDHTFDIPDSSSSSNPEESFNELMDGQSTVTSDGSNSSVQSENVDIGTSEAEEETTANAITSIGTMAANTINLVLQAVATNQAANFTDGVQQTEFFTIGKLLTNQYPLFNINMFAETPEGPNSDISNTLKDNAAVWYVATRNIAAVGCAITLVYVGIRMAISASAEDSAKYKKMLMSWLVGVILLFVIQYIVAIMISLSDIVVDFINRAIENNQDVNDVETAMLSGLAAETSRVEGWEKLIYTTMNCVLVFYEIKFFVIYLFRVLKIFIMTVIAPFICLSYPIDAVGDGKPQAFNNWFKEIMIQVFIQPMHLILYVVFMLSAGEIAKTAPIIGIIFIISLDNAEKVVRSALKISGGKADKGLKSIKIPGNKK